MKKKLIIATLLSSIISLAGPKSDLIKAKELFENNKEKEAIKILENSKAVKGEEEDYEKINYNLAKYYLSNDMESKAKTYLEKISSNEKSKTNIAKEVDYALYNNSENETDKIKYLERLNNRLDNENMEILALLISTYETKDESKKISSLLNEINKKDSNFSEILNYYIAENLIGIDFDKANKYLRKAERSKNDAVRAESHFLLARYYYSKKDDKKVNLEIEKAIKEDSKNFSLLFRIGELYKQLGNNDLSYKYLKEAYNIKPKDSKVLLSLIINSHNRGDKKDQNRWEGIIRNSDKNITNEVLSNIFITNDEIELAKEFSIKSEKEGNKNSYLTLLLIYINENNKSKVEEYENKIEKVKDNKLKNEAYNILLSYYMNLYNKEKTLYYANKIIKSGTEDQKKLVKPIIKEIDLALAELAYSNNNYEKAKELALVASKNSNKADVLLAYLYFQSSDFENAKKYANSAIKNNINIEDAKKILNEIEKIK